MGSVRRQLILCMAVLAASPAAAGVCESVRPDWTAAAGIASGLDEVLRFLGRGGGAVLLLGLLAGLYLRKTIILNAVMVVTLIMAVPYLWPLDPLMQAQSRTEGCVGPATLVTGLLAMVWVAALGGTLFKRKPA
jgi:hypothetical protein